MTLRRYVHFRGYEIVITFRFDGCDNEFLDIEIETGNGGDPIIVDSKEQLHNLIKVLKFAYDNYDLALTDGNESVYHIEDYNDQNNPH